MMRRNAGLIATGIAICTIVMVPGLWLETAMFSAWAAGVQACGVVVAFVVGGATLATDRRERRVDRVIALQAEYETGDVADARGRLSRHLRRLSSGDESALRGSDLRAGALHSQYAQDVLDREGNSPGRDLSILLNFFDRVEKALERGALDKDSVNGLLGHHVEWWYSHLIDLDDFAAGKSIERLRSQLT